MKRTIKPIASLALALLLSIQLPAFGHGDVASAEEIEQAIARVRQATQAFHDVDEAKRAGYAQFLDCVAQPDQGAMGTHYLHSTHPGDAVLDQLRPEALMYAAGTNGELQLVGVEYIVFQDVWDAANPQPPVMFGHPFHLVRAPNRYGVPAFYELHLWIWKHNGNGIFNDWNPSVRCS
jgi:hypothetical protein